MVSPVILVTKKYGSIASSLSPIHMQTRTHVIQKWRIQVPVGEKMELTWTVTVTQPAEFWVIIISLVAQNSG